MVWTDWMNWWQFVGFLDLNCWIFVADIFEIFEFDMFEA